MERNDGREALVIRVDGVFDARAAQLLADSLDAVGASREVKVDLTDVREFHDLSVGLLAQALSHGGPRVLVRGLRQHHLRLLRYLGVDSGAQAPAADVA